MFKAHINLSAILGKKKLTQAWLADHTGIRSGTINDLFWEDVRSIRLDHIDKICQALDCTPDELITWERTDEPVTR